jgi:hypothetical protein
MLVAAVVLIILALVLLVTSPVEQAFPPVPADDHGH